MTTTVTTSRVGPLTANGVTPIPFTFQSLSASEIRVSRAGETASPSTYTVQRNADGSGSITPTSSWGADTVFIYSSPSWKQLTDFARFGVFFPDMINSPLDRLARYIIALKDEVAELRALIGEGGGTVDPPGSIYFPATGLWDDTELFSDAALWKD